MISTTQSVNKKSFTLFEVLIAIFLISLLYIFAINSFQKTVTKQDEITLKNVKQFLLKQEFKNDVVLKCTQEDIGCFLFIDGELHNETIPLYFSSAPTVYEYSSKLDRIEFIDLELVQLQRYEIVFEYSCNKQQKCREMIVETEQNVLIFNNFYKEPKVIEYISDIDSYFENKVQEVKDAF